MLALGELTTMKVFRLSTSVLIKSPVAVGVPTVVLFTPPASKTGPEVVPVITALSFVPAILTVTTCEVPSTELTVKVSVSVLPTFKA